MKGLDEKEIKGMIDEEDELEERKKRKKKIDEKKFLGIEEKEKGKSVFEKGNERLELKIKGGVESMEEENIKEGEEEMIEDLKLEI